MRDEVKMNKIDLVEFSCEYVEVLAQKKYGKGLFDELQPETQNALWTEAEQEFYENAVEQAEHQLDEMKYNYTDKEIDEFLNAERQENFCN